MAQPALLADRHRSGSGFTVTVLMLLATLVAIGAIAFAAVDSAQQMRGNVPQPTIGLLRAQVLPADSAGAIASEPLDRDG